MEEEAEVVETVVGVEEVEDAEAVEAQQSRTMELWWWESTRGTRLCVWIQTEETCALPSRDRPDVLERAMEESALRTIDLLSTNVPL